VGIAAAAFALTLGLLASGGAGDPGVHTRELDALGVVLAAAASLPLLTRRRAPLAVFAVTAAASVMLSGLGYASGPPFGPTIALFFLAVDPTQARAGLRVIAATVAGLFAAHVAAGGMADSRFPLVQLLFGTVVWGGAWVLGDRIRQRRERMAALEERALRAEREAEREGRLAAAEERTRIARDLHDSAGHAINVILVQAGAARLLQEQDPAKTRIALETIEEVARETVIEIDQLVRVLRENGSGETEVEPPPGLAALEGLAERHRASGLAVSIRVDGTPRHLAPGVDRAAYRILQEALTNAARHGGGSAEVSIAYGPKELELEVTNPATLTGPPRLGHGIVGMRERTTLLGGSLDTSVTGGRFRVQARLPHGSGVERR
jgi:signal transduction histidine kinase